MSTLKLRRFEGVGAGQTAVLTMPIGNTFRELLINFSGVTLAQMTEIRLVVNGDVIDRYLGAEQLQAFNDYRGMKSSAGILHYTFERPNLLERSPREVSALGTGMEEDPNRINTLQLEIDIDAGATAPQLSCVAIQTPPAYSGIVRKTRHFTYDSSQAGEYQISDLPRGEIIDRIYFRAYKLVGNVETKVDINEIQLQLNEQIDFQRTKAENEHMQKNGVRVVNGDWFVYDPSENGYGSEGLDTRGLNRMEFMLKLAEACRVVVSVEYFGFIPNKA